MDGRLAANGIVMVGFSLGGNLLLKYLGEQGHLAPFCQRHQRAVLVLLHESAVPDDVSGQDGGEVT